MSNRITIFLLYLSTAEYLIDYVKIYIDNRK